MKFFFCPLALIPLLAWADEFPKPPNTESTTDADPPSAEESAKSFPY
ncbi:MAG: hypothetical protein HN754_04575 [Opitutae bacterium]|nr:hypothetical protein [Opitutae bacterium]